MPERVQRQFRSWLLDREQAAAKNDALWQEWQQLDPASVFPVDEKESRREASR